METHQYTFQEIRQMLGELTVSQKETEKRFQETEKRFQETDRKFQETDREFQETKNFLREKFLKTDIKFEQTNQKFERTEKLVRELSRQLGGIANSNGDFAEEFFFHGFSATKQVAGIKYDYIEANKNREIGNFKGEYDIVLVNENKILIIEVKYKLKKDHITEFYNKKMPKFKKLFPEYEKFTVYGAMAAFSFEKGTEQAAENKGFLLFTQFGENIKKLSPDDILLSKF